MIREKAIEVLSDVGDINRCCAEDAEALDMAIKALEQQPSEDCISREAVLDILKDKWNMFSDANDAIQESIDTIEAIPPVTPQQKIGRWILLDECSNSGYYCSECHKKVIKEGWSNTVKKVKYCPNCGAKMEGEDADSY